MSENAPVEPLGRGRGGASLRRDSVEAFLAPPIVKGRDEPLHRVPHDVHVHRCHRAKPGVRGGGVFVKVTDLLKTIWPVKSIRTLRLGTQFVCMKFCLMCWCACN